MYTDLALYIDGKWLNGSGRDGEDVDQSGDREALGAAAACERRRSRPALAAAEKGFALWRDDLRL